MPFDITATSCCNAAMLTKAKHTRSSPIERVFSGALADVGSSAFCENFISQKASVSKVATVTVTAEAVM